MLIDISSLKFGVHSESDDVTDCSYVYLSECGLLTHLVLTNVYTRFANPKPVAYVYFADLCSI